MSYRIVTLIILFALILLMTACIQPINDSRSAPNGDKLPLSGKQPIEMTSPPPKAMGQQYMRGEVMVKLKSGVHTEALDALSRELGLKLLQPMPMVGTYLMRITSGDTVEAMVKMLNAYKVVDYAEPNFTAQTN